MRVYVINLPRCVERREHIEAQVRGLDHEFIETVDARTLNREDWPERISLGTVGCGLSHLNAYRHIIRDNRSGLVVEDDAILPQNTAELLDAIETELAPGDVALLYYRVPPGQRECTLHGTGLLLEPETAVLSGCAYVITPEACRRLLEFDALRRGFGIDDWDAAPVRPLCVAGRPVRHRFDFPSSIGYANGRLIPAFLRTWNRRRLERQMSRFRVTT